MAFRFRRRIPIIAGVRLNVSKKGLSLSGGMRGASVTAGQHGVHGNVGAPGTGLSYRTRLNQSTAHQRRETQQHQAAQQQQGVRELTIHFVLQGNGDVEVVDTSGTALNAADQRTVKRNYANHLTHFLAAKLAELDAQINDIRHIHEDTPHPNTSAPTFSPEAFSETKPTMPQVLAVPPKPIAPKQRKSLFAMLVPALARRAQQRFEAQYTQWQQDHEQWQQTSTEHEAAQHAAAQAYQAELTAWQQRASAHNAEQARIAACFDDEIRTNRDLMADVLTAELDALDWPLPLEVDFDIGIHAQKVWIDVGLAADEHWPKQSARLGARGDRLVLKKISEQDQRMLMAQFAHGLVLRLAGSTFASLAGIQEVIVSGYRHQVNPATGFDEDAYWLSVRVTRAEFGELNFADLSRVDPIAAVSRFELQRNMTSTSRFKPITPITPAGQDFNPGEELTPSGN